MPLALLFLLFQVLSFIRDLYSFEHVRYTSREELRADVMRLARSRLEAGRDTMQNL